jgi:tetratricopeptide (TPR) repeat protein
LSPGQTILFLKELAGNSGSSLNINIQRIGSTLSIIAILQDPKSRETKTWEITRILTKDNQSIEDLMPAMAEDLAFQIAISLIKRDGKSDGKYPITWQAFKNMTEAKKAYLIYKDTKNVKYLDTASNMSIRALYSEPDYSEAFKLLFGLSRIYLKINEYEKAEQIFKNIIDVKPAESAFGLGMVYAEQKRYNDALDKFNSCIELSPFFAEAWNGKGIAFGQQEMYNDAIKAYDEAIRLDPKYAEAWNNKGNALRNMGMYDEAIKAYDEAIRLDPKYAGPGTTKALLSQTWVCTMRPFKPVTKQSS